MNKIIFKIYHYMQLRVNKLSDIIYKTIDEVICKTTPILYMIKVQKDALKISTLFVQRKLPFKI